MKKTNTTTKYKITEDENIFIVSEPEIQYLASHPTDIYSKLKDFKYKQFKKILDKSPFSLNEWALLLHISERTLQRYAKDNSEFNGLLIDRILELENLIDFGKESFGDYFYNWLHSQPFSLLGKKPIEIIQHSTGIKQVYNLIGQIIHGNLA